MKKIKGVFHVSNTEFEDFNRDLKKAINDLQADNQEVEIQYGTNIHDSDGQILFSALLLGRVDV